ncbi:hypothetical protein [Vibrio vulnificus]|uniref:hypothetical protein n=1 Tax=Vibrio vulnificus TaxID=672 RepID=UPI001593AB97|nr:hypothetical protein [Vibrio vulnificus]NVC72610.1 hypothetical protein [Vibrio vulnificus]
MFKAITTLGGAAIGGATGGPMGAVAGASIGSSLGKDEKQVVQGTSPEPRNEGALMNMFRQSSDVSK